MPKKHKRGFVLLMVLAVLTALMVIVYAEATATASDSVAASQQRHQARARIEAENCLERTMRVAREIAAGEDDLDQLLDPNGTPAGPIAAAPFWNTDGDEFMPPGAVGNRVYVPSSYSGTGRQAMLHAYRLEVSPGGDAACLVRYDDNFDDWFDPGTHGLSSRVHGGVVEGAAHIPSRDRDSAMTITVIALYPYRGTPATAYDDAKARVTLRGYLQSEVTITSVIPAIHSGASLDHNNGNGGTNRFHVCGIGSISVSSVGGSNPTNFCTCGAWRVSSGTVQDCGGCGADGCSPSAPLGGYAAPAEVAGRLTVPVPDVHPTTDWGLAGLAPADPGWPPLMNHIGGSMGGGGNPQRCEYWYDDDGKVFYWDHSDTQPWDDPLGTTGTLTTTFGMNIVWTGPPATPPPTWIHNCSTYAATQVGSPCDWDMGTNTITCDINQTPCWKYAALLDDSAGQSISAPSGATWNESTDDHSGEGFEHLDTRTLPFAAAHPVTYQTFCGNRVATNGHHRGFYRTGGNYVFSPQHGIDSDNWGTQGEVHIVNNASGWANRVQFPKDVGASAKPLRAMFIIRNDLEMQEDYDTVCPTCTSVGDRDSFATCSDDPDTVATGYALVAGGHCVFSGSGEEHDIVGSILCRTVDLNSSSNQTCITGNIQAWDPSPSALPYSTRCVQNDCTNGGICIGSGWNLNGRIQSEGEFCVGSNNNIRSSIIYIDGQVDIDSNNLFVGPFYTNTHLHFLGDDNRIEGNLTSRSTIHNDGQKTRVVYSGSSTPTASVLENAIWTPGAW
jgi:hypothetical protein